MSTVISFLHNRHKIGRLFASVSGLIFVRVFPPQMGQSTHFSGWLINSIGCPDVQPDKSGSSALDLQMFLYLHALQCIISLSLQISYIIKSIDTAGNASHLFLSLIIFSAFRSYLMSRPFLNALYCLYCTAVWWGSCTKLKAKSFLLSVPLIPFHIK